MKLICATFLLLASAASAQSITPKAIDFTGAPQYPQPELLKLSGLTPGKAITQADIEAAMHKLDDSGLFAGINFTTLNGVLTFTLEPIARATAQQVAYTNFAWYTRAELTELVHNKLPFFNGDVPSDGDMAAQVERALEAILKERGIDAKVTSQAVRGGRLDFSIATPPVLVGELHIENVNFAADPTLDAVNKALTGAEYIEGITNRAVHDNLAYALEELGYLDEKISPIAHAEPRVQASPGKATRILVDLTGSAQSGERYKVARVDLPPLAGTMTESNFDSEHRVSVGGLPSPSLAQNSLFGFRQAYVNHGFLDATVTVDQTKDQVAHTMSYTFKAVPGEVYHMRNLVFTSSVSTAQQSQLTQAWKLPKGAVYNGQLVGLSRMGPTVNHICNGKPAYAQPVPDKATHEVDVNLSCTQQGK